MKLGLLTACLPGWDLARIARTAAEIGYERLEVAAWPRVGGREFEAAHLPAASFGDADVEATREILDETGLEISALAFYDNNLHHDPELRAASHAHLRHVIRTAAMLEVPYVGTFIGRDVTRSVPENMREGERVLPELVAEAADQGVTLLVENCVMEGWHPDGYPGNIAYSPELWDWMIELGFRLNWDPSHLMWIGIDPLTTIEPYLPYIAHVQAKDIELSAADRNRVGVFGTVHKDGNPWATGWWRYRVPGLGGIDWGELVGRLRSAGYDGVVSVEHEDPVWGGDNDRTLEGVRIAHRTLAPLVRTQDDAAGPAVG